QRRGDILPLADHFLRDGKRVSAAARDALLRHLWPGNVRELKNVLQRAQLLAPGKAIEPADLGLPVLATPAVLHAAEMDAEPDREQIEAALTRAGGIVSQAAGELGLSRQALYRRMDKLGIARV